MQNQNLTSINQAFTDLSEIRAGTIDDILALATEYSEPSAGPLTRHTVVKTMQEKVKSGVAEEKLAGRKKIFVAKKVSTTNQKKVVPKKSNGPAKKSKTVPLKKVTTRKAPGKKQFAKNGKRKSSATRKGRSSMKSPAIKKVPAKTIAAVKKVLGSKKAATSRQMTQASDSQDAMPALICLGDEPVVGVAPFLAPVQPESGKSQVESPSGQDQVKSQPDEDRHNADDE